MVGPYLTAATLMCTFACLWLALALCRCPMPSVVATPCRTCAATCTASALQAPAQKPGSCTTRTRPGQAHGSEGAGWHQRTGLHARRTPAPPPRGAHRRRRRHPAERPSRGGAAGACSTDASCETRTRSGRARGVGGRRVQPKGRACALVEVLPTHKRRAAGSAVSPRRGILPEQAPPQSMAPVRHAGSRGGRARWEGGARFPEDGSTRVREGLATRGTHPARA